MRIGNDVEVLRRPPHQQIAHASAAEIGPVAAAMQAVQNLQDVFGDAAPRDPVTAAVDDDAGGLDLRGLFLAVVVALEVIRLVTRCHRR
jgi:hypothetical protein